MSETSDSTTQTEAVISDTVENSVEAQTPVNTSSRAKKRLKRDTNDKVIGGVCSGIAKYFDVDPILVRAIFAVALFGFGTGALAYIVLLVIMPEA